MRNHQPKNSQEKIKPWLNKNGEPFSDEELKKRSSSWAMQEWEDYLSSLEVDTTEILLEDPSKIEFLSETEHLKSLEAISEDNELNAPKLRALIKAMLNYIPENQKQVIHNLYWEKLTLAEISRRLGVSKTAVRTNARSGV